eukprot:m.212033 g.212033  ORF g.212033 m.212033 type:complete len:341 (-) comp26153_c3_seq8:47-1069(-)
MGKGSSKPQSPVEAPDNNPPASDSRRPSASVTADDPGQTGSCAGLDSSSNDSLQDNAAKQKQSKNKKDLKFQPKDNNADPSGNKNPKEKGPAKEGDQSNFARAKTVVAKGSRSSVFSAPEEPKKPEVTTSKSVANRLLVKTKNVVQEESILEKKGRATKLFAADDGPKKSKIYQALNPDKLFFESRREKEEAKSEVVKISVRGMNTFIDDDDDAPDTGFRDYSVMRDDEGNIIEQEEEEEEEEEDIDPKNLPDFGEFQEEMNAMRAKRAAELEARRAKLRAEHQAKKEAEEAERQAELKRIAEREAKEKARLSTNEDNFVVDALSRIEKETNFGDFKFST